LSGTDDQQSDDGVQSPTIEELEDCIRELRGVQGAIMSILVDLTAGFQDLISACTVAMGNSMRTLPLSDDEVEDAEERKEEQEDFDEVESTRASDETPRTQVIKTAPGVN